LEYVKCTHVFTHL